MFRRRAEIQWEKSRTKNGGNYVIIMSYKVLVLYRYRNLNLLIASTIVLFAQYVSSDNSLLKKSSEPILISSVAIPIFSRYFQRQFR